MAAYLRGALPGVPIAKVEAFAAVLLETAGSNLMFALEAPPSSKADHLAALRLFVVSALAGLRTVNVGGNLKRHRID